MDVFDLSAKISLDSSEYEKGLNSAEKQSSGFASKLSSGVGKAAKIGAAAIGTISVATAALGKKFYDAADSTADYGDKVDKMSQKIGMSAESYQKWDYVMQRAGTSIDGLKMGMKTLSSQAQKNSDSFQKLGISQEKVKNLSQEDLFEETVKGLSKMEAGTERTKLATELLGRTGADLGPLLNQGSKAIEDQMKIAEDYGMVMSDKAVAASATFKDSLTTLSMTATGLKNRLMGEFLPSLTKVTDGLALLFTGDTKGLDDINKGIGQIMDKISSALPKLLEIGGSIMESLANSLISNLPTLMESTTEILSKLLNYIVETIPTLLPTLVKSGVQLLESLLQGFVEALPEIADAGIQAILTLMDALNSTIPELIPQIIDAILMIAQTLIDNAPLLIEGAIQLFTGIVQGLIQAIPLIVEKLPELITSLINGLVSAIPMIIDAGIQLFTALVENLPAIISGILNALPELITAIINGLVSNITLIIDAGVQLLSALVDNLPAIINAIVNALPQILDAIINALLNAIPQLIDAGIKLFMALIQAIPQIIVALVKAIPQIIKAIINAFIKAIPKIVETGKTVFTSLAKAIPAAIKGIISGITKIKDAIFDAFADFDLIETGKNLIEGLWNGISDMAGWIKEKLESFGDGVVKTVKKIFGVESPSKVFAEIGGYLAEGLGKGWEEEYPDVSRTITQGLDFSGQTANISVQEERQQKFIANEIRNATNGIINAIIENGETSIVLNSRELGRAVRSYV